MTMNVWLDAVRITDEMRTPRWYTPPYGYIRYRDTPPKSEKHLFGELVRGTALALILRFAVVRLAGRRCSGTCAPRCCRPVGEREIAHAPPPGGCLVGVSARPTRACEAEAGAG